MGVKMNLMQVLDVMRYDAHKHTVEAQALYFACVKYVSTMPQMTLPSGGVMGGEYAFVRTGALLKTPAQYVAYRDANNLPHYVTCETVDKNGVPHGRQATQLAHIFPRAFGGHFDGVTAMNITAQCGKCNHSYSDTINPLDVKYLSSIIVEIDV